MGTHRGNLVVPDFPEEPPLIYTKLHDSSCRHCRISGVSAAAVFAKVSSSIYTMFLVLCEGMAKYVWFQQNKKLE
jgi:hypothetical protein